MAAKMKTSPELSRRGFLVGTVGTSVLMGFGAVLPGCAREEGDEERSEGESAVAQLNTESFSPTIWFELTAEGALIVNTIRAEMGQHVGTALARIVADELGAAWSDVSIVYVESDPKWGLMVTGGSWSVNRSFVQLSQAGAAGRIALIEAAAALMGVAPEDCVARDSRITAGSQSLSFAEVVQRGQFNRTFTEDELAALPLKTPEQRDLIGKTVPALDIAEKSTGQAVYGIDVERPGMVYARPVMPPTRFGSTVNSVDDSAAKAIPGYLGYEQLDDPSNTCQGWVVAIAESYNSARLAADALVVDWTAGPKANISEADIIAEGVRVAGDLSAGALWVDDGDVAGARESAARTLDATYTTSTALHFQLEPVNAVAELDGDTWRMHCGNQFQTLGVPLVAAALGVPDDKVVIHQYYLGGGFGRRLAGDYMVPAALTAKAIGKPVKLVFTREDDARFDNVRSASVQRLWGSVDADGKVTGIEHAAAAGWPTLANAPALMPDGLNDTGKVDPFAAQGADHWYTLPNHRVRVINNEVAQQTFTPGWLRAVGAGWIGWAVEGFMDELATATGQDPIEFRLAMLDGAGKNAGEAPVSVGGATRLARVLERVRDKSDWGRDLPDGEGLGVAVCAGQERTMPTWIACVAHVAANAETDTIEVKRLTTVIDCGTAVNPDGALAQAESATLWGLSLTLHEGTAFADGQVADWNLDTYTPLRMGGVPELDIEFIDSTEFPVGMGEPPLIVVGPAIANAIYQATGVRVRDMPIRTLKV